MCVNYKQCLISQSFSIAHLAGAGAFPPGAPPAAAASSGAPKRLGMISMPMTIYSQYLLKKLWFSSASFFSISGVFSLSSRPIESYLNLVKIGRVPSTIYCNEALVVKPSKCLVVNKRLFLGFFSIEAKKLVSTISYEKVARSAPERSVWKTNVSFNPFW